jgi:hypothetical protein
MQKLIIILAIIILTLTGYSFFTHNIANNNIKDIKEMTIEIQKNSILLEENTIEIRRLINGL